MIHSHCRPVRAEIHAQPRNTGAMGVLLEPTPEHCLVCQWSPETERCVCWQRQRAAALGRNRA